MQLSALREDCFLGSPVGQSWARWRGASAPRDAIGKCTSGAKAPSWNLRLWSQRWSAAPPQTSW